MSQTVNSISNCTSDASTCTRIGRKIRAGFTLVEILVVMAIFSALIALSGPAVQAISGAGTVNKAIGDLSGTLEAARAYAMANRTYVRVAIAQTEKGTVILPIYAADGSLDAATAQDMASPLTWRQLNRALVLRDFVISDDVIQQRGGQERVPSDTDIEPFARPIPGIPSTVTFDQFVQFSPNGEARVEVSAVARFIKIGMDRVGAQEGRNPFEMIVSGTNGTIRILRADDKI